MTEPTPPGMTIGDRYELLEEIGSGAMAVVYRARDTRYERDVAIKVLHPTLAGAVPAERFLREIQIGAALQHPHIITLFDSGQFDGRPYYAMPLVSGESLRDRLARTGPMPLDEILRVTRELAGALDYAHQHGVVHRDVKPANILLSSGIAVLADFGIARAIAAAGSEELTETGIVVGTPAYMSPEQAAGDAPTDARSDVYSLGCVVYEMLAGEPPFLGRTAQAVLARQLHERVPSLSLLRSTLPPGVVEAVDRALAKVPADRYETAMAFADALAQGVTARPRSRARLAAIAAGAVTLAALAWLATRLVPNDTPLDQRKVAVFPLEERGLTPGLAGAGTDVALTIETALEYADPLRPVEVRDRLTPDQLAAPSAITSSIRSRVAAARGARFYIAGIVQAVGDSLRVILRLHDAQGDSVIASRSADGPLHARSISPVAVDAVKQLLPSLVDPGRDVDLRGLRDRDASALALFLQGEREYRLSHFPAALGLYERAFGADSALALAAVKGAQAASWAKDAARAQRLVELAVARDSSLPPRYRQYARGLRAFLTGRTDSAASWFSQALAAAPGWSEAHMALGEVYHHLPGFPSPDSLAALAFSAAVASDSGFSPPLFHLAEFAIREGEVARATDLVGRYARLEPNSQLLAHLELMLACVREGAARFDWDAPTQTGAQRVLLAGTTLAVAGQQLACADGAFRAVLRSDSTALHWGALLSHNAVLAATNDSSRLVAFLDSVVAAGKMPQAMMLYLLDATAGVPVPDKARGVELYAQSRWGARYDSLRTRPRSDWILWTLGIWHAVNRDTAGLGASLEALEHGARSGLRATTRLYADALAAHRARILGDAEGAARRLRALAYPVAADSLTWEWGIALPAERLALAELHLEQGRYTSALRVASTFDGATPLVNVVFLPQSLAVRYRAALALDARDAATTYRRRLLALGRRDLVEPPQ